MDTINNPLNDPAKKPEVALEREDHTLEDLAALTGLFNPDAIVDELRALDKIDEQEEDTPDNNTLGK